MQLSLKRKMRWSIVACSLLVATLLLTACGGSSTTTTTPITTASSPIQAPVPTTTDAPLKIYQGEGFRIGYPVDWTAKPTATGASFTDATKNISVLVSAVADPEGVLPADKAVEGGMKAFQVSGKNYKPVALPARITLAGETWPQQGATVNTGQSPAQNEELVTMATVHPPQSPNSKTFIIVYKTLSQSFDQTNMLTIQPMLQSFRFA